MRRWPLLVCIWFANEAFAGSVLYQSATLGPINQLDGYALSDAQYLGVRFRNYEPWRVEEVGGHLFQGSGDPAHGLFAALVPIDGPDGLPASADLNAAVWSSTFSTGGMSQDVFVDANVLLPPGWWVVVFGGGGLFGSDGAGGMSDNNLEVGEPSFVRRVNGVWEESGSEHKRFVVKGYVPCIPETADTGGISCPEDCSDGFDNDADGLVDCQDRECWHLVTCCDADGDGFDRNEALCGFGPDCDDSALTGPNIYPGALETINDGIDSDCDGVELCYEDLDADGYGSLRGARSTLLGCDGIIGVSAVSTDCDDSRPAVYPGAPEVPGDAIDGDCDGGEDCFEDLDGDGFGTDALVEIQGVSCHLVPGAAFASGDCLDVGADAANRHPGAAEIIGNGLDEDCDGTDLCWLDLDGDGWGAGGTVLSVPGERCDASPLAASRDGDCEDVGDAAPWIHPGAPETAGDGIDQDCDGRDACFVDGDGDGYGSPVVAISGPGGCDGVLGLSGRGDDCDDDDPGVSPGAAEIVGDSIDQDCNTRDTCWRDFDLDGFGGPVTAESTDRRCDVHLGLASTGGDCLDAGLGASMTFPGAPETVADGLDQDCDGHDLCWVDGDLDGFGGEGTQSAQGLVCGDDPGEPMEGGDCADTDARIYPGATEEPGDGIDQDCDGLDACWIDGDGDGVGGDETTSALRCDGREVSASTGDCNDGDATVFPGAWEVAYDQVDQDCDGVDLIDADGDGWLWAGAGGADCDDDDAGVHPGAVERANGLDDNCVHGVDEGTELADDDGDGATERGGDCNDADPSVGPGAPELCDGIDNDCDFTVDESTSCFDDDGDGFSEDEGDCNDQASQIGPGQTEVAGNGIDDDCDGVILGDGRDEDADGYTRLGGDCGPRDASTHPGAPERADGIDNDCDGVIDEGTAWGDDDGDGVSERAGDCDDGDPAVFPGATERIDGKDTDCNGRVDDTGINGDADGDGFTINEGDCDDEDPTVLLLGEELPDGKDNDCDGLIDEGLTDLDGDGWSIEEGDCNDRDGWASPERVEVCDGIDNNCDEVVDEGCLEPVVVTVEVPGGCQHGPAPGWLALGVLSWIRRRRGSRVTAEA